MRINEAQVRSGFFWLPDKPDVRVPGTLTITDGGRIEVDALDTGHALHSDDDRHARVLGLIEQEGYVTLENCHVLRTSWEMNAGLVKTRMHASHAFFSVHLVDDEVLMLKRFQFSVEGLDEWLEVTGIEATADWAASTATLTYKAPPPVVVSLDGKQVSFEFSWTMSPNITEGRITQRASVSIESNELARLEEFTRVGSNDKPQNQLFYSFNLDEVVPEDHLLRHIDRFLDFSDLRQHLAAYYSHTGRPSVDPELMIRMLLIGYCLGIRSERQLCEEVKLNLAYRWFCRLSITDAVPDHSTFSKNRHGRFRESEAFRYVFEQVLKRCIEAGLVKGEGFAVDASVVKADASRQREHKDDDDWGSGPGVREYLEGLDAAAPTSKTPPRRVSPTDPAARWTAAPGGPAFYAYSTNYLVDTEAGIIVDVEATPAHRSQEVESTKTMVERVKDRFGIDTKKLIGDTAYGTAEFLAWMVNERGIEPHVPVWEKAERSDETFSRSDFSFDEAHDTYTCPNGKLLYPRRRNFKKLRGIPTTDGHIRYRASVRDCGGCPLKQRCCPNTPARKVTRSVHESARDVARAIAQQPEYSLTRRHRKKVEILFAHMKRILKVDRLRLRGLGGAREEFLLTAAAQNLRRMAKILGTGPPKICLAT